jgi:hypothetical protein
MIRQRLASRIAVIMSSVALLIGAFAAAPAQAASGGGCSSVNYHSWGHHYACISAPYWGHFVADGYIQAYASHGVSDVVLAVYDSSGQQVYGASRVSLIPSGASYFRIALSPFYKPSGSVRAVVNFRYLNNSGTVNHNAISPYLNLP